MNSLKIKENINVPIFITGKLHDAPACSLHLINSVRIFNCVNVIFEKKNNVPTHIFFFIIYPINNGDFD